MDEGDHLLPATQAALRSATEEFSQYCSFIITANYPNRIIEPLHSRFVGVDFNADKKELEQMQAKFYMRCVQILKNEGIEFEDAPLISVIQKLFPDNRRILNTLQQYGRSGKIDVGILMSLEQVSIESLVDAIKSKKFKAITQFAVDNSSNDTSVVYEKLYKIMVGQLTPACIPDVISILEQYQRYDSVVPSKELHLAALGVELMMTGEFK
jgi:DNA polymerase III delta prime subunit